MSCHDIHSVLVPQHHKVSPQNGSRIAARLEHAQQRAQDEFLLEQLKLGSQPSRRPPHALNAEELHEQECITYSAHALELPHEV